MDPNAKKETMGEKIYMSPAKFKFDRLGVLAALNITLETTNSSKYESR